MEAGLAPEGDGVKVVFLPTENPVVQSVRIETEVLKPEVFREFFSQKEGEVLNFRQLEQDLDALEGRVMQAHGYVVQPVDVAMSQSGELIISLAGARLGEIIIKGNTKTRDNVIRREFTVRPGEYLNMYQLEEDLRRVLHLGFFDEVRRSFVPVPDTDMFNLEVEVVGAIDRLGRFRRRLQYGRRFPWLSGVCRRELPWSGRASDHPLRICPEKDQLRSGLLRALLAGNANVLWCQSV